MTQHDLPSFEPISTSKNRSTPSWPAIAALAVAILSIVLAASVHSFKIQCIGYVLGGLVAPAFVAIHRRVDLARKSSVFHTTDVRLARLVLAAIALSLIGASYNAWLVATELSKR